MSNTFERSTNEHIAERFKHAVTAVFWARLIGGWLMLTLEPGEKISTYEGGVHDEGYSHSYETWEHVGDKIVRTWRNESRDCDGRHRTGGSDQCALDSLRCKKPSDFTRAEHPHVAYLPDWADLVEEPIYDEYAQTMNY